MTPSPYSVKGVKSFTGREGLGFEATLCRDGKAVAHVLDEARGGVFRFDWADHAKPSVTLTVANTHNASGGSADIRVSPEEASLRAWVAALPPMMLGGEAMTRDMDMFVASVVDEHMAKANLKRTFTRSFKDKVVGISGGDVLTFKVAPTPDGIERVRKHKPGVVILNGLHMDEAVTLAHTAMLEKSEAEDALPSAPVSPAAVGKRKRSP